MRLIYARWNKALASPLATSPLQHRYSDRHSSYCAQTCHHESLGVATHGLVRDPDLDCLDYRIAETEAIAGGAIIKRAEHVAEADKGAGTMAEGDITGNTTG